MKLDHLAIWVNNLEEMRSFYTRYFGGISNELYTNSAKNFTSYFISFETGCRLELMHKPGLDKGSSSDRLGLNHIAFSVGSREEVNRLTNLLQRAGYEVVGEPRVTGDGYYESVILDPEGNRLELTG